MKHAHTGRHGIGIEGAQDEPTSNRRARGSRGGSRGASRAPAELPRRGGQAQLVAAPGYLARRGAPRSPRELERHEWVTYAGAESLVLEAPGSVERLMARGRIRCDDMFFAHAAARAGGGITLLPTFLAEPSVAAGELVAVLPRWHLPTGAIWLVHPAAVTSRPSWSRFATSSSRRSPQRRPARASAVK